MSTWDFESDAARPRGGRFHNLAKHGPITGIVIAQPERRLQTYEGEIIKSRKSGEPRYEYLLRLATDLNEPRDGYDDDGQRIVVLKERNYDRLVETYQRTPEARPLVGCKVTITIDKPRAKPTESDDYGFVLERGLAVGRPSAEPDEAF